MGPITFDLNTVDEKKGHYFQELLADVHRKLKHDPTELTTEDARRLSENVDINDRRAALLVTAVESYVIGNEAMHEVDPNLGQAPHTSLSTILNDLKFAVELNPHNVTQDHLKSAQEIVSSRCLCIPAFLPNLSSKQVPD